LILGIARESAAGERRVALVPDAIVPLVKRGLEVRFERAAGENAGFRDADYEAAGARPCPDYGALVRDADVVLAVQPRSGAELAAHRSESVLISLLRPLDEPERAVQIAAQGIDAFSLELMPRITRAQSMDVLSSQSTIAGYRAVLLAAAALPRVFPMLVTAAGTLQPAKLLVIGAGVAGLQALGTGKRLGAVTSAYDTRVAVREQVESVGARFVSLGVESAEAEDAGGYARAQSEDFYERQREALARHIAASDVVITTALVPGQPAPRLIPEAAVRRMRPASVIVDLAAEKGGNCDCTEVGRDVVAHGVTVIGRTNLPAEVPAHASQMYARNVVTFLDHLLSEDGGLSFDLEDEITAGTLVTRGGEVVHPVVLAQLAKREKGA
jgi:NAD(P) transhydrogenase subunit alpha